MRRQMLIYVALASCILLGQADTAQAYRPIMHDWQDYYNACAPLVALDCDVCHTPGSTDYNPYGDDMRIRLDQGMTRIEAFVATEAIDSDGGGATNGQEIVVDCTSPGTPADDPTVAGADAAWGAIKALFR